MSNHFFVCENKQAIKKIKNKCPRPRGVLNFEAQKTEGYADFEDRLANFCAQMNT